MDSLKCSFMMKQSLTIHNKSANFCAKIFQSLQIMSTAIQLKDMPPSEIPPPPDFEGISQIAGIFIIIVCIFACCGCCCLYNQ